MTRPVLRIGLAIAAFVAVSALGVVLFGTFDAPADPATEINVVGANSFALILAIALVVAFVVYAAVEYAQTGRLDSISRQFDTRTIVLMPIAIALNIVLGQAVGAALKVPIYLDSIGTILVGALAGPIPGALTGFLANILWTYVVPPPFHSDISGAFAIVAAIIGLLAGVFGRLGWLRPRPDTSGQRLLIGGLVAVGLIGVMAFYALTRFYGTDPIDLLNPDADPLFLLLGVAVLALIVAAIIGFFAFLFLRRDLTVAYSVVAGVVMGVVAALISAPISANLFSGVTGAGTDFLVAAFRQGGSDIQTATFQQGLLSDPIDKLMTFLIVYLILNAMARRTKARFPQGERLVEAGAPSTTGGAPA